MYGAGILLVDRQKGLDEQSNERRMLKKNLKYMYNTVPQKNCKH